MEECCEGEANEECRMQYVTERVLCRPCSADRERDREVREEHKMSVCDCAV